MPNPTGPQVPQATTEKRTQMGPRQTATANQLATAMTGERFTASSRPGSRLASGLGEASDTLQNTVPGLSSGPAGPGPLELEGLGQNARPRPSPHSQPHWGRTPGPAPHVTHSLTGVERQAPPLTSLTASLR